MTESVLHSPWEINQVFFSMNDRLGHLCQLSLHLSFSCIRLVLLSRRTPSLSQIHPHFLSQAISLVKFLHIKFLFSVLVLKDQINTIANYNSKCDFGFIIRFIQYYNDFFQVLQAYQSKYFQISY